MESCDTPDIVSVREELVSFTETNRLRSEINDHISL